MASEVTALGPLFGPNYISVEQNDDTGRTFALNIYPDANNPLLRQNGLPTQYYFMPQRVYLAKRQSDPSAFDFGVTVFKGLMTDETTLGIRPENMVGGEASVGGGICSFATTFAIPNSVLQNVAKRLKRRDYQPPSNFQARFARFFDHSDQDALPQVGIVPILENTVTIEVPNLVRVGDATLPFFIDAQGAGKGSIEAQGISSFLITMNQFAAGAIVGSLEHGRSPFTVHYNMKCMFYINACDIHVEIDVDKVFEQFSAAGSAGSLFGIFEADLSHNYQACITSGAIKTTIKQDGAVLEANDALKKMIDQQSREMQQRAFELVKSEIFDWHPQPDPPASANRGVFGSIFGGAAVALKSNYQRRGIHLDQQFRIDTSTAIADAVSGTLNDLEGAIQANLGRYLSVIDIGEHFRKLQVAATTNVSWSEDIAGVDVGDPIKSIQVEVGYPDYTHPLGGNGQANPQFRATGFHYVVGEQDPHRPPELARWDSRKPNEVINISFLKLANPVPGWEPDEVLIRKTIVYDPEDPRVDFVGGATTVVREVKTKGHAPIITPDEVGKIFVRFFPDRPLPKNVSVNLTWTLGSRNGSLLITSENQKNAILEIYSDKYFDVTSLKYELEMEVISSDFIDDPVVYGSEAPRSVSLPEGRMKVLNPHKMILPSVPADKAETVLRYIRNFVPSN
jgi:hypothetical protein